MKPITALRRLVRELEAHEIAAAKVGDAVRRARIDAGLTTVDLAARIGQKQPNLSRWESGRKIPSIPNLQRIVHAIEDELRPKPQPARSMTARPPRNERNKRNRPAGKTAFSAPATRSAPQD